jgi:hypothetical protein
VEHEVTQLEAEFDQRHYTACALRVGRSLEYIVYSLATAWGVRLDDPVFNIIDDLQQRLQAINSAILVYRESEGRDREAKRKTIREGSQFAARLHELGFLLDDKTLKPSTAPPRNVEAILRDVRKTYSRFQVVRDELKEMIEGGLVRKILEVRNEAAHADVKGKPREIARKNVVDMLENVRTLVHKLSLVGDVIMPEIPKENREKGG